MPCALYHYERKQGTTTLTSCVWLSRLLYHYERKQGTTTAGFVLIRGLSLYHYERKQGTTTSPHSSDSTQRLYHYERKQGTTTQAGVPFYFENYTTTRENRELRLPVPQYDYLKDYTTTRENRELRLSGEEMRHMTNYTTTRENWELRQCDHIEEINFHHIVILAAAEGRACEGRIKRKKGNTGTVLNMENISPQVTSEAPQRANVSFHNILSQESGVKASGGSHCRFDIFPAIFFLLLVEMAFYGIINL